MTETKISAVVTEKVLENLAEFWADPQPDFMGRQPARIAGSPQDQEIPAGMCNPYWEIVRHLPVCGIGLQYDHRYQPDGHFFSPRDPMRQIADRHTLCATFAWSIISPGDITWITERLGGRGVVEPGAGGGYWAWQLAQAGVDVAAYDPAAETGSSFTAGEPWFTVLPDGHDATRHHPDRALLLCWPSYSEPWAAQALAGYKGDQLFYAGEGPGGCCADDAFFDLLEAEWTEADDAPQHVTYSGIHCYLTEYRRRTTP